MAIPPKSGCQEEEKGLSGEEGRAPTPLHTSVGSMTIASPSAIERQGRGDTPQTHVQREWDGRGIKAAVCPSRGPCPLVRNAPAAIMVCCSSEALRKEENGDSQLSHKTL
jgi:hypothetical protein